MPPTLGWYPTPLTPPHPTVTATPSGFTLHLSATPAHLHAARALTVRTLARAGVDPDVTHTVQLVLSELCGNAVRACGDFVPLVAEVQVEPPEARAPGVWVRLHDPCRATRPERGGVRLDDPDAESGRGLSMLDLLAPGWGIAATPVGKQVRCRVPYHGS